MNGTQPAQFVNTALLFILCVCVGAIVGFMLGDTGRPTLPTAAVPQGAPVFSEVIALESVWIVEGLTCPEANCDQPLISCEHPGARQIRSFVNSQLAVGRRGEEITADIVRQHGARVQKVATP